MAGGVPRRGHRHDGLRRPARARSLQAVDDGAVMGIMNGKGVLDERPLLLLLPGARLRPCPTGRGRCAGRRKREIRRTNASASAASGVKAASRGCGRERDQSPRRPHPRARRPCRPAAPRSSGRTVVEVQHILGQRFPRASTSRPRLPRNPRRAPGIRSTRCRRRRWREVAPSPNETSTVQYRGGARRQARAWADADDLPLHRFAGVARAELRARRTAEGGDRVQ